jgi:hypothetical protein
MLNESFVYKAPTPIFAGLKRLDNGVVGGMEMFASMLVFR